MLLICDFENKIIYKNRGNSKEELPLFLFSILNYGNNKFAARVCRKRYEKFHWKLPELGSLYQFPKK